MGYEFIYTHIIFIVIIFELICYGSKNIQQFEIKMEKEKLFINSKKLMVLLKIHFLPSQMKREGEL